MEKWKKEIANIEVQFEDAKADDIEQYITKLRLQLEGIVYQIGTADRIYGKLSSDILTVVGKAEKLLDLCQKEHENCKQEEG